MVHFESFSSFYNFIETLKKDDIQFKIVGRSYEHFSGMQFNEMPDNNQWSIELVALSSIGSFYLSESINIDDTEKITDIKVKLATLPISDGEVSYKKSIVSIK